MRGLTRLALAALVLVACTTRKPSSSSRAANAAPIEVRGAHGELLMSMQPGAPGAGWTLLLPDQPPATVTGSADGAQVKDASGKVLAEIGPGTAGFRLSAGDELYRGNLPRPPRHLVHILTPDGVTIIAFDYRDDIHKAVARDSTTRQVATAVREPDRVVIDGKERIGTVHNLPAGPDAEVAAVALSHPTLPPVLRAAICAHLLSR